MQLILSGGGSMDQVFQMQAKDKYESLRGVSWQQVDLVAQSLVTQGIVLNLLDPEIGNFEKFSKKSYGIVYTA